MNSDKTNKAAGRYPGIAENIGNNNRNDAYTRNERTKVQNNNPRNHK